MKTNIFIPLDNFAQALAYIKELNINKEFYDLRTDPTITLKNITIIEAEQLRINSKKIFELIDKQK